MIAPNLQGLMGNHMFQYTIARLVALKNNYEFFIPNDFIPKQIFKNLDLGCGNFIQHRSYSEDNVQTYDPNVFNIQDNTLIYGYFQSEKYFEGYENEIKKWFSIDDAYIDDIDNTCYIHFRGRGNIGSWITIPKSYYDRAKERMLQENSNMKFKIITDDVECAKQYFENDEIISDPNAIVDDTIVSKQTENDFKLLKTAKYVVINISTYSWWAAWLNNNKKLIIAPDKWYNFAIKGDDWFPKDIRSKHFEYITNI